MRSFARMPSVISDSDMSTVQLNMIDTMSKYVVLVSIILLSTLITIGILASRMALSQRSNKTVKSILWFAHVNWLVIDLFLNIVCLMTQFNFFGKNNYQRYCYYTHLLCKLLFKRLARNDMKKRRIEGLRTKKIPPNIKNIRELGEANIAASNNQTLTNNNNNNNLNAKLTNKSKTKHKHKNTSKQNARLQISQKKSKLRQASNTLTVSTNSLKPLETHTQRKNANDENVTIPSSEDDSNENTTDTTSGTRREHTPALIDGSHATPAPVSMQLGAQDADLGMRMNSSRSQTPQSEVQFQESVEITESSKNRDDEMINEMEMGHLRQTKDAIGNGAESSHMRVLTIETVNDMEKLANASASVLNSVEADKNGDNNDMYS